MPQKWISLSLPQWHSDDWLLFSDLSPSGWSNKASNKGSTYLVSVRRKMSFLFLSDQTPLLLPVCLHHTALHRKDLTPRTGWSFLFTEQTHKKCRNVIYRWILFISILHSIYVTYYVKMLRIWLHMHKNDPSVWYTNLCQRENQSD